jgi:hypothetical protein
MSAAIRSVLWLSCLALSDPGVHDRDRWEDMSIEDLPVGTNTVSFSRRRTDRGIEYGLDASEKGWNLVLKERPYPGAKYYVNGRPLSYSAAGIRMSGRKNRVLVEEIQR